MAPYIKDTMTYNPYNDLNTPNNRCVHTVLQLASKMFDNREHNQNHWNRSMKVTHSIYFYDNHSYYHFHPNSFHEYFSPYVQFLVFLQQKKENDKLPNQLFFINIYQFNLSCLTYFLALQFPVVPFLRYYRNVY